MENQIKNKVKKRLAIYGTMFLLGTTSLNLVGCSEQIVKEPTKTENVKDDKTEELATSEIGEKEVTESNVVSVNAVVEESSPEKELPVHTTLTEEEKQMINDLAYETALNNPPENGIYSLITEFDFDTMFDGKYKEYESCKYDFMLEYNIGYTNLCFDDSYDNGVDYLILADGDISTSKRPYAIAKVDIISIIYQESSGKYWVITNYQGEPVIEPNTYVNMRNSNLIEDEITNFSVTPMRDYMEKEGTKLGPGIINQYAEDSLDVSLFNTSKTR